MNSKEVAKLQKIVRCIDSCTSLDHVETCEKLIRKHIHDDPTVVALNEQISCKIKNMQNGKHRS